MTSVTRRLFLLEPLGDKLCTELAGIETALGERLTTLGFAKAYKVLGQFLILEKNKKKFKAWLKNEMQANANQSNMCYNCLNDWCNRFMN